jgi:hypothetical protein
VVVSTGLIDLLEDRALIGFLSQASLPVWTGAVAGELVVWLGNLPLVCAWFVGRGIAQVGRPLAVVVGASLVLPLALWPVGFTRWAGRLFGSAIVALLGIALVSSGFAAAGLGLLLGWAVAPGLQAVLAWEWRRTEASADHATIDAGLGWHLLEALETLIWAESAPGPGGLLGALCRSGAPLTDRADRLWRALSQA